MHAIVDKENCKMYRESSYTQTQRSRGCSDTSKLHARLKDPHHSRSSKQTVSHVRLMAAARPSAAGSRCCMTLYQQPGGRSLVPEAPSQQLSINWITRYTTTVCPNLGLEEADYVEPFRFLKVMPMPTGAGKRDSWLFLCRHID
jgi:hypothetical protein